jgi:hypothetical protein
LKAGEADGLHAGQGFDAAAQIIKVEGVWTRLDPGNPYDQHVLSGESEVSLIETGEALQ